MLFNKHKRLSVKDKLRIVRFFEESFEEDSLSWPKIVQSDEFKKARPFIDKRALNILEKESSAGDGAVNGHKAIKKTLLRAEVNLLKQKWGIDR